MAYYPAHSSSTPRGRYSYVQGNRVHIDLDLAEALTSQKLRLYKRKQWRRAMMTPKVGSPKRILSSLKVSGQFQQGSQRKNGLWETAKMPRNPACPVSCPSIKGSSPYPPPRQAGGPAHGKRRDEEDKPVYNVQWCGEPGQEHR